MAVTPRIVDFTNVKDGQQFNKRRVPEGDYLGYVSKVQDTESKADGEFMYLLTIKLKKYADVAFPYYCKLSENQLWKIRNVFQAAGIPIAKKKMKIDPTRVIKRPIAIAISDDEYQGKPQSQITAIFSAAELELNGDSAGGVVESSTSSEEEEEVVEYIDDEEEDEEESTDLFESMDRTTLKAYIKEREADFRILKSITDDELKAKARALQLAENTINLDDEEEEEEEEEEPPPPPKKTVRRKRVSRPAVDEMEELDIDDL